MAQTTQGTASETLTLEQAIRLAEQFSPLLQVGQAMTEGANAAVTTAHAYPNPEFNTFFGHQYQRLSDAVPGLLEHYSAGQIIELPTVRRARIAAAQYGLQSSRFLQADTGLTLRATVKQAFYLVLRRRNEIDLAHENLRVVEELRRRIRVQVEVGEAARLELTRADAEVAAAATYVTSAQLRLISALAGLRNAIGAPLGPNIVPEGKLDAPVTLPPLEILRQEVLAKSPLLSATRAEISRSEARLRTEMALRTPPPILRGEYERQPDLGFYRFGVSIPVPIIDRRKGPIAEAVAGVKQARAIADLRRVEVASALDRAYGQYQVAHQQVAAFEQGVLKQAEAALSAAQAAYQLGERGIIEVLDAQRVLRTARQDFLNAQFDLQSALIDLEQLQAVDLGRVP